MLKGLFHHHFRRLGHPTTHADSIMVAVSALVSHAYIHIAKSSLAGPDPLPKGQVQRDYII